MTTLFLIVICIVVAIYLFRAHILRPIASFLISNIPAHQKPDAIVLMNGNISTRPFLVAELYKKFRAPILIARLADTQEVRMGVIPNISESTRELLIRLDVPAQDIHLLSTTRWVAGTWNEAILLCDTIRENNWQKINIVTDAFHSRRACWAFRKVMKNETVDFRCSSTRFTLDVANQWWRSEYGVCQLVVEYLKFAHYLRLARAAKHTMPNQSDLPQADDIRPVIHGQSDLK